MIFIDALYINNGGGLRLLNYMVNELQAQKVDFFLLADDRCEISHVQGERVLYMKASFIKRMRFYKSIKNQYSSVLCFGNIPSLVKLNIPVYTYFHNINLLTLSESSNPIEYCKMWLKRQVFRYYRNNTDYWIVQTSNTASELINHLHESSNRVVEFPFFDIPDLCRENAVSRTDYVFIGNYYNGAKGHNELLKAWEILHENNIDIPLHLTVDNSNIDFVKKINDKVRSGVKIINHGTIPFSEVAKLYWKSKAIIYPSHNESLGLGIIEAIKAGCDVIGADLPYLHAICIPSIVFSPYSADSIADAVIKYEQTRVRKSELLIKNKIREFIEFVNKKNYC